MDVACHTLRLAYLIEHESQMYMDLRFSFVDKGKDSLLSLNVIERNCETKTEEDYMAFESLTVDEVRKIRDFLSFSLSQVSHEDAPR
jgi:hypothetical protein